MISLNLIQISYLLNLYYFKNRSAAHRHGENTQSLYMTIQPSCTNKGIHMHTNVFPITQ